MIWAMNYSEADPKFVLKSSGGGGGGGGECCHFRPTPFDKQAPGNVAYDYSHSFSDPC